MRHVVMLAVSIVFGALIAVCVAWATVLDHPLSRQATTFVAAESHTGAVRQFVLVDRAARLGVEAVAFTGSQPLGWYERQLVVHEEVPATPGWAPWPAEKDLASGQTRFHLAAGWPMACVTADCVEVDQRWGLTAQQVRARQGSPIGIPPQVLAQIPRERRMQLFKQLTAAPRLTAPAVPQWHHALVLEDQQVAGPFSAVVLPYRPLPAGLAVNALVYSLPIVVLFTIVRAGRGGLRRLRGRCPRCAYRLRGTMVEGCPECGWGRAPVAA